MHRTGSTRNRPSACFTVSWMAVAVSLMWVADYRGRTSWQGRGPRRKDTIDKSLARTRAFGEVPSSVRLEPAPSVPELDLEGHAQRHRVLHAVADDLARRVELALGELEQELVVHLEQHPAGETRVLEPPLERDHRLLDHVRGRALHRRVHRRVLGEGARAGIRGRELGEVALATEHGLDEAVAPRLLERRVDPRADLGEGREVAL